MLSLCLKRATWLPAVQGGREEQTEAYNEIR